MSAGSRRPAGPPPAFRLATASDLEACGALWRDSIAVYEGRLGRPIGTVKIGMPFMRYRVAAWSGAGPLFQSPSDANIDNGKAVMSLKQRRRPVLEMAALMHEGRS